MNLVNLHSFWTRIEYYIYLHLYCFDPGCTVAYVRPVQAACVAGAVWDAVSAPFGMYTARGPVGGQKKKKKSHWRTAADSMVENSLLVNIVKCFAGVCSTFVHFLLSWLVKEPRRQRQCAYAFTMAAEKHNFSVSGVSGVRLKLLIHGKAQLQKLTIILLAENQSFSKVERTEKKTKPTHYSFDIFNCKQGLFTIWRGFWQRESHFISLYMTG